MALEQLTANLTQMSERMRDLRPVADEVHAELLAWQRTVNIGEKNRLDPSLQDKGHPEHIWFVRGNSFYFGTSVPYSIYHHAHLLAEGKPSHLWNVPKYVLESIGERIGRYIVTGGTL